MQQLRTTPFGEQKIAFTRSSCGGSVPDSLIAGSAEHQSSALFLSARKQNPRRPKSAGVHIGSLAMTYFHWKYNQLSSAQRRFTVLFGMGRSGTATLWSPGLKRGGKVKHSSFRLRCSHYPIRLKSSLNFSVQGFTVIGSSFTSN